MTSVNASAAAAGAAEGVESTLRVLRYGSLAILGGYTISLCYRVGLFRRLLPTHVNTRLEQSVEAVKARTEPIGNVKRFSMARSHLLRAYGWAASGMVAAAAGVAVFCWRPKAFPIALPLIATTLCSVLVVALPKKMMIPPARVLCFYVAAFSAGYCFGPLGWAAQDSLLVFVMLTGCTMTGLCVPLFLTRGMVSYVLSAQLLSLALSLSLVTAPKQSKALSPFRGFKEQRGVQVILNGDVNVLLTMQFMANIGINLLHTLPTIYRYVAGGEPDNVLEEQVDPLKEAFCICAGWGYVNYRLARYCTKIIVRKVIAENTGDTHRGSEGSWTMVSGGGAAPTSTPGSGRRGRNVDLASSATAGLVSVLWYVRVVSLLQKGDATATMDRVRDVCARISPVALILGSQSSLMSPAAK